MQPYGLIISTVCLLAVAFTYFKTDPRFRTTNLGGMFILVLPIELIQVYIYVTFP